MNQLHSQTAFETVDALLWCQCFVLTKYASNTTLLTTLERHHAVFCADMMGLNTMSATINHQHQAFGLSNPHSLLQDGYI